MCVINIIKLTIIYISVNSIVCYENVYDLLERRNQYRLYEPQYRNHESSEVSRYGHRITHLNRPRTYYTTMRPYFSEFGNGYDNIGNGIPMSHFLRREFQDGGRPLARPYNNHFRHALVRNPYRFNRHPDYSIYPKYEEKSTILNKNYGNEFGSTGNLDVSKIDRYLEDNEDKKHKKTDEIFQRSHEGINSDSVKKENSGEKSHLDQSGENKSTSRSNKVVKKGYSTKGFSSHHHKDETGNSTTFFDESSDFGGHSDFKDIADGFGTRRTLEQINHRGDEKFFRENGGQTGNYGSGLLIGNQRFEKDFSSTDRHTDEDLKFATGKESEDVGVKKDYRYLNGERFDFSDTQPDNYY